MNGTNFFIDTNIALYLLNGDETIAKLLHEKAIFISFITELELLGYKYISKEEINRIEDFLKEVTIVDINSEIKKIVIELRKSNRIKLPDAIIAGSSNFLNFPLLTSDKGFSNLSELNILLYEK